jgi:hypothetical protein
MQSLDLHHLRLLINLIGTVAALIASGFWFRVTATKVLDDKEKEAVLDQLHWDLERLGRSLFRHNCAAFILELYLFARLIRCRHERFFLIESVIPMIGCACYSNRADMEASHGREIFSRKI